MTARLHDIDRAKGFAIFLVVLGHIVAGDLPEGNEWFGHVIAVIYSFHMPFFMYLSGFVMMYTFKGTQTPRAYREYVSGKFKRLAPGFFVFALVILSGKLIVSRYLHVDNMPDGLAEGLISILLTPGLSAAKSLWFIYVLFLFYAIFPVLLFVFRMQTVPIVIVGLLIHFLPATPYLMLDGVFEYLVYFSIGIFIASHYQFAMTLMDRYRIWALVTFLLSFSLLTFDISMQIAKLFIGLASIPALHALMRWGWISNSSTLLNWGLLSYAIYLMNTIAIGFVKGVTLYYTTWDGVNFLWIAPLLLLAGLYGPIVVKLYVLPWIKPLDRITS